MAEQYVIRAMRDGEALLRAYNPDAIDGYGAAVFTTEPDEALRFDSIREAFACWQQSSTVRPVRDDGKPNRPLTAYTIEVVPLDPFGQPRWPPFLEHTL